MSATATPIRECDHALDYLYAMLEGEAKLRFEAHLAGCPRCQAELASLGKVRVVAQATLPTIEPSERLTGALHAQLMHAASQRKPRGKVIPFLRRVVSHPGYAAAAALVLVGGAVGLQWSRGKLLMPAPVAQESAPAAAPVPAPQPVAPVTAAAPAPVTTETKAAHDGVPAAEPVPEAELAKRRIGQVTKLDPIAGGAPSTGKDLELDRKAQPGGYGKYKTTAPAGDAKSLDDLTDRRAITARLNKKDAAGADDTVEKSGGAYRGGVVDPQGGKGGGSGSVAFGTTSSGRGHGEREAAPPAPPPPAPRPVAKEAPPRQAAAPATTATPPALSPAPAVKAPMHTAPPPKRASSDAPADGYTDEHAKASELREEDQRRRDESGTRQAERRPPPDEPTRSAPQQQIASHHASKPARSPEEGNANGATGSVAGNGASNVTGGEASPALANAGPKNVDKAERGGDDLDRAPPQTQTLQRDDVDTERERAAKLAQAGRCEEATTIYSRLDKQKPDRLNPQDRLTYSRCLRALGRLEPAQDELNQLRANKAALPAAAIDAEQKALDRQQQRNQSPARAERRSNVSAKPAKKSKAAADQGEQNAAPADANAAKHVY